MTRHHAFFIPPFPDASRVSSSFEQADIIYMEGGNTYALLSPLREFGVTAF
jgi:peptidase E